MYGYKYLLANQLRSFDPSGPIRGGSSSSAEGAHFSH
jgi:hypothetical protein